MHEYQYIYILLLHWFPGFDYAKYYVQYVITFSDVGTGMPIGMYGLCKSGYFQTFRLCMIHIIQLRIKQ